MEILIIILFAISAILLLLTFFMKDRTKAIENDIENLTLNFMQEMFQLKKKITILEEDILVGSDHLYHGEEKKSFTDVLMNEVINHFDNGYSIEKISELTALSENEVLRLIAAADQRKA